MVEPKVVVPDKLAVMPQPTPEDVEYLAQQGYRSIINNRPDNEQQEQPKAADVRAAARERKIHYEHLPVTVESIMPEDVYKFREAYILGPHPVAAHCGTGKRSYFLWAAGEVLDGNASVESVIEKGESLGIDTKQLREIVNRVSEQEQE